MSETLRVSDFDTMIKIYYVGKLSSFRKAAQILCTSQPRLSRTIKDFEDRYGAKLFERNHNGVKLTRRGMEVYDKASKMYDEFIKARKCLIGEENKNYLRILTTPGLATTWIMQHIPTFLKEQPDTRLTILGQHNIDSLEGPDVAIWDHIPNAGNLVHHYLMNIEMGLYASKDYLREFGEPKSVEDLKHHRFIAYDESTRLVYITKRTYAKGGNFYEPYMRVNLPQLLFSSAQAGLGIVELPASYPCLINSSLVEILPQVGKFTFDVYYIHQKMFEENDTIKKFLDFLKRNI
jgi:DNA-binding transcriptional LysR family regulator